MVVGYDVHLYTWHNDTKKHYAISLDRVFMNQPIAKKASNWADSLYEAKVANDEVDIDTKGDEVKIGPVALLKKWKLEGYADVIAEEKWDLNPDTQRNFSNILPICKLYINRAEIKPNFS